MDTPYTLTFGKHRGLTLDEVLIEHPSYFEWLRDQAGMLQSRPELAAAFRELGASPDETPLHNAMQVMFLDKEICASLVDVVFPEHWTRIRKFMRAEIVSTAESQHLARVQEITGIEGLCLTDTAHLSAGYEKVLQAASDSMTELDKVSQYSSVGAYVLEHRFVGVERRYDEPTAAFRERIIKRMAEVVEAKRAVEEEVEAYFARKATAIAEFDVAALYGEVTIGECIMEPGNGADVSLAFGYRLLDEHSEPCVLWPHAWAKPGWGGVDRVYIELKPSVGDEYPSILRQVGTQQRLTKGARLPYGEWVVIAGRYSGIGASIEQVKAMFASQGVTFLLLNEFCGEQPVLRLEAA